MAPLVPLSASGCYSVVGVGEAVLARPDQGASASYRF